MRMREEAFRFLTHESNGTDLCRNTMSLLVCNFYFSVSALEGVNLGWLVSPQGADGT